MTRGKLTLFLGDTAVGVIDVGRDGMPGLTFHLPAKKAVGMESEDRVKLRNQAYAVAGAHKEDKENPSIPKLAKDIAKIKRNALARDPSLVFGDPKRPVPNAALARLVLAAKRAMQEVLLPAYTASGGKVVAAPDTASGPRTLPGSHFGYSTPRIGGGGGNGVTIKTVLDSGATDPMVDELTRKQSKVPLDTKSKHNF